MTRLSFNTLSEHCKHQGMLKEGKKWCGYMNGVPAKCWSDWQECTECNCYLVNKNKPKAVESDGQISIVEMLNERVL